MPLIIVRNDITKMACDAIVNAANSSLLGGGGVDGAIHRAAGLGLLAECRTLGGCETGQAKITGGYDLPAKYVIHTVGPIWNGGGHGEAQLLRSCYAESLRLAEENHCQSVAFPMISTGVYGYPKDEAFRIAADTIEDFLRSHEMAVYLVIFGRDSLMVSQERFAYIQQFIDDNYVDEHSDDQLERRRRVQGSMMCNAMPVIPPQGPKKKAKKPLLGGIFASQDEAAAPSLPVCEEAEAGLEEALSQIDESFSQMLLRKIDELGMTDVQCYKKANIDRKLFSKIRSDVHYRPKKATVIAFAVALELDLDETKDMLMKAGFALSHSSKFDIIVEYFIARGNYNVFEINEALFSFDQSLIGQ